MVMTDAVWRLCKDCERNGSMDWDCGFLGPVKGAPGGANHETGEQDRLVSRSVATAVEDDIVDLVDGAVYERIDTFRSEASCGICQVDYDGASLRILLQLLFCVFEARDHVVLQARPLDLDAVDGDSILNVEVRALPATGGGMCRV